MSRKPEKTAGWKIREIIGDIPDFIFTSALRTQKEARITLKGRDGSELAVILGRWPGEPVFLNKADFDVRYMGEPGKTLSASGETALKIIAERLGGMKLDELRMLAPDQTPTAAPAIHLSIIAEAAPVAPAQPASRHDSSGTPFSLSILPGAASVSVPEVRPQPPDSRMPGPDKPFIPSDNPTEVQTVTPWGGRDRWRRFIFRREFERNWGYVMRVLQPNFITVSHGESECFYSTPPNNGHTLSIHNYPWIRPLARDMNIRRTGNRAGGVMFGHLNTDLKDVDIITGGNRKLDRLLGQLAGAVHKDDLVVVRSTCVPHVIGDDMAGSVRKWKGPCRIVFDDIVNRGPDLLNEFLVKTIGNRPGKEVGAGRQPINLLGVPETGFFMEIMELLKESGTIINSTLIPTVDSERAQKWLNAAVQVAVPNPYFNEMYKKVFLPLPVKTIMPPAPYGLGGAREWMRQASGASGFEEPFKKVWKSLMKRLKPALGEIRRQASSKSLGFIISGEELRIIRSADEMAGIPVWDMVLELGFRIELFVFLDPDFGYDDFRLEPGLAERVVIHRFSNRDELMSGLEKSACSSVYTDLSTDERIVTAGKTPFNLQFFEPGPGGALETARRLLGACAPNILTKYGGHAVKN